MSKHTWTTTHDTVTGVSCVEFPGGRVTVCLHLKGDSAKAYTMKDGELIQTNDLYGYTLEDLTMYLTARALEAEQLNDFQ